MTKYSRSVIPGRPQGDEPPSDLDRLIFGGAAAPVVRQRGGAAPIDDDPPEFDREDEDDDPPPRILQETEFKNRSTGERRKAKRRKSDYSRLPSEARAYGAPPEDNRRGLVLLTCTVVVLGVFGAVVWNAYSGGVKSASAEAAPTLEAPGPFKTKPELVRSSSPAPASENASVFERRETGTRSPVEDQRQVIEDVEAPEARVAPPEPKLAPEAVMAAPPPAQTPAQTPAQAIAQSVIAADPAAAKPPLVAAPSPPALSAAPAPAPAVVAEAPLAGGYRPAIAADGAYMVQIGSLLSEEAAKAEWARVAASAPELFAAAKSSIVRADVNGETRYRLRVAAFATADEANAFCGALKSKGRDCYRTTR